MSKNINIQFAITLTLLMCATELLAQHHNSFDSAKPTWSLRETDCQLPESDWIQSRVERKGVSGRQEKIQYRSGTGTKILISHKIPRSYVIPELMPSVRINANQPGVQLAVRVVLPETPDDDDPGKPMTTLLKGPISSSRRAWETLSFRDTGYDIKTLLDRHIWVLRRQYGAKVSARNAYIDLMVLNIYAGPGRQVIEIDDLKVDGVVSAKKAKSALARNHADAMVQPAGYTQEVTSVPSHIRRNGTVVEVNKRPFFARVIQHNGESFELLKSLGFNTIELNSTATEVQLVEAQQHDVWLVCPPPASVGLTSIGPEFDRVLAWSVGQNLSLRDVASARETVQEIHESDVRSGRPIVGHVSADWSQVAPVVDILNIGFEPLGTSFVLSQYSDWIEKRTQVAGNNHPVWGDLQTEITRKCREQISAFVGVAPPTPIEPQQLKYMAYEIIASGARGIRFRSRSRLDASDPSSQLRVKTLHWLNRHLTQIGPWIAGGAKMRSRNEPTPELIVTPIRTARSQLLLLQRPTGMEQHYSGDTKLAQVLIDNEGAAMSDRAYLLADYGLIPLSQKQDAMGAQIQIDDCPNTSAIVLTQDPNIVTLLNQPYRVRGQTLMQQRVELVQQWIAITHLIQNQMEREGRNSSASQAALADATSALQKAESLINSASPIPAARFLEIADQRLAVTRRELILTPLQQFQSKSSSPLLMHASLIPLHWKIADNLSSATWQPNSLPGGDFENLQHMTQNGWENRRVESVGLSTKVELSQSAKVDGNYGLKMSVNGTPKNDLVESTPLWIATGRIPIQAGHLVRIHGWVKIDRAISGTMEGLIISDNLGGPDLAERIQLTQGWQEFSLYRATSTKSKLQVKFELKGVGEVLLDEVTIRTVEMPTAIHQARR